MLMFFLELMGVILLILILVMIIDGNRFVIREYTINNDKIKKDYNFILLSDLHNKQYGKDNYRLIQKIKQLNPDGIIVAGDMLTAKPGCEFDIPLTLLHQLTGKYPVYYGIGNHEYRIKIYKDNYGRAYDNYISQLKKMGVVVLENDAITLQDNNIRIQGVMIDRKYYKRFRNTKMNDAYLPQLLGKTDSSKMQIYIAHNPDYFKEYAYSGADLVLSGHLHGGVMRLPLLGGIVSPKCTLFPKYDGGLFKEKKSSMIVSRGLGMHTIPIRIFNPGELIMVHLKSCK